MIFLPLPWVHGYKMKLQSNRLCIVDMRSANRLRSSNAARRETGLSLQGAVLVGYF